MKTYLTRLALGHLLACTLFLLSACDFTDPLKDVDLILKAERVPIELKGDKGALTVESGQTTLKKTTFTNDLDVKSIDELKQVQIKPEYFTFTPAAGKTSEVYNGTVRIFVFLDGQPVTLGEPILVTVEDSRVTDVTPKSIEIEGNEINRQAIEDAIDNLPEESRPDLEAWKELTVDEVIDELEKVLARESFPLTFVVETTGNLSGTITVNQIDIDVLLTL